MGATTSDEAKPESDGEALKSKNDEVGDASDKTPQQTMSPLKQIRWAVSIFLWMLMFLTMSGTAPVTVSVQTAILERTTDCASGKVGVLKCAPMAANYATAAYSVSATLQFLSSPYYGALSDRWGRKPFVCLAMLYYYFPVFFLLGSPSSMWPFYVAYGLNGLCPSWQMLIFSMIADVTPPGQRLQAFSYIFGGIAMIAAVGSLVVIKALTFTDDEGLLNYCAIVFGISFVLLPLLLPETLGSLQGDAESPEPNKKLARSKSVAQMLAPCDATEEAKWYRWFFWLFICSAVPCSLGLGAGSVISFYMKDMYHLNSSGLSSVRAVEQVGGFLWQTVGLTCLKRVCPNDARVFQVAAFLNVGYFLPQIFFSDQWAPYASSCIAGANALLAPSLRSIISEITDASSQGRVSGILDACNSLTNAVGPATVGQIYSLGSLHGFPQLAYSLVAFGVLPFTIFLASFTALPSSIPESLVINKKIAETKNLKAKREPLLS